MVELTVLTLCIYTGGPAEASVCFKLTSSYDHFGVSIRWGSFRVFYPCWCPEEVVCAWNKNSFREKSRAKSATLRRPSLQLVSGTAGLSVLSWEKGPFWLWIWRAHPLKHPRAFNCLKRHNNRNTVTDWLTHLPDQCFSTWPIINVIDTVSGHHIKVTDGLVTLHTPVAARTLSHSLFLSATCHDSYNIVYPSCQCRAAVFSPHTLNQWAIIKGKRFLHWTVLLYKRPAWCLCWLAAGDLNEAIIKPQDKLRGKRWLSVLLPQRSIDPEGRQRENWEMLVLMPIQYIRHLPRDGAVQSTTNPLDRDVFQRLTRYCAAVCTGSRSRLTF